MGSPTPGGCERNGQQQTQKSQIGGYIKCGRRVKAPGLAPGKPPAKGRNFEKVFLVW